MQFPSLPSSHKGRRYFILPFEILANVVTPGNVLEFSEFDAGGGSAVMQGELDQWCQRTAVPNDGRILSLGVWGDAAPYHTRDGLYLLTWNILSGTHHKRYWATAFTKREVRVSI